MNEDYPTRISLAKEAAISVVNTLSPVDTVSVITFNSNATSVSFTKIVKASSKNKETLAKEIEKIVATGGTRYEKAFNKAFELLDQAKND